MTKTNDVAIFILTHGRAYKQDTLNTLKKLNCKTPIYLIVDNMDEDLSEYQRLYDNVIVFDKREIKCDTMTNREEWASPVYARNYADQFSRENGIDYYVMMDDDITDFRIRAMKDEKLKSFRIKDIDAILHSMRDYMAVSSKVAMLGFAQSGAYIGGASGSYKNKIRRDISQVFMCRTKDVLAFRGIVCQDYIGSLDCNIRNKLCMATFLVSITSPKRMSNKGGLYETYAKTGVYVRDFYKCMAYPSTGRFNEKQEYQKINNHTFPKVLSGRYKK